MRGIQKTTFFAFLLTICIILPANSLYAQTITATITGTINDPNGAVVPGAAVTATSIDTGLSKTTTTNESGDYTITFLPPGSYNLKVSKAGYSETKRENIKLEVAQSASLNIVLGVTAGQVTVDVDSNSTPLLQTETSNLETTIENKLIEDLPAADRSVFSFVNLVPGTIDTGASLPGNGLGVGTIGSNGNRNFFDSNFSLNGGRNSSNEVLLDGVTNTIGDFNGVTVSPPQDAVREFKFPALPRLNTAEPEAEL